MTGTKKLKDGCELCGDFPVHMIAKCHPSAPLLIEMLDPNTLRAYCYVPDCHREVFRVTLDTRAVNSASIEVETD